MNIRETRRLVHIIVIMNKKDPAILYLLRAKNDRKNSNAWTLPGGGVERDETTKEAAVRGRNAVPYRSVNLSVAKRCWLAPRQVWNSTSGRMPVLSGVRSWVAMP